jgi:hypothetical protein
MDRTPIIIALLFLSSAYAEVSSDEVQRIVRDENQRVIDHQALIKEQIQAESVGLANKFMEDVVAIVERAERKVILIATLGIGGVLILIEGFFGWLRIRRERDMLLLIREELLRLNTTVHAVKKGRPSIEQPPAYQASWWQRRREAKRQKERERLTKALERLG